MIKRKTYWTIEFMTKDNRPFPSFSPKYYGNFKSCKNWIRSIDFLKANDADKNLTTKIIMHVE